MVKTLYGGESNDLSTILMLVLCVSVRLSVCPPRDLEDGTSYRCASFTGIKRFSWRVAQTAFWVYMTRGSRGKVFGTFRQVTCWRPCMHITLPGYPGQDESCPPPDRHLNILEGHGYHSWYCFHMNGKLITWLKNRPVCERVTTSIY